MSLNKGNIPNLEERRKVWGERRNRGPANGHDLRDSLPYPFDNVGIAPMFDRAGVMEIGPGNGRQYDRVRERTRLYCIADISQSVLMEPVFSEADGRFLIDNWGQDFSVRFDVVHFWYVFHHVRHDEMFDFFNFVHRHLRCGGLAAFNGPQPINVQGAREGDGCGTTYSDPGIVTAVAAPIFRTVMVVNLDMNSTGHVYLMQKIR